MNPAPPSAPGTEKKVLPKVLLVDDEENILRSLRRLLRKDFDLSFTTSPEEALTLLREQSFAVIVSDQRMPVMEGTELMARAQELAPDAVRIILSGYADLDAVLCAINDGAVYRFLTKPWNEDQLLSTLNQAVAQYQLVRENKRLHALTESQNDKLQELNKNLKSKVLERTRQVMQLNGQLSLAFQGAVQVLSKLAELHSPLLGRHAERVADLSVSIGRLFNLSKDELYQLEMAARLHDIGKIGLPSALVERPFGDLKPGEKGTVLTNSVKGASLVCLIPDLESAAEMIRHRYERYDGMGFPMKLSQNKIPLGSRIIAVVDSYDALLNGRTGFSRMTKAAAFDKLVQSQSSEFDPDVLRALKHRLEIEEEEPTRVDEIQLSLEDLCPGMVLTRDVVTLRGVKLWQANCMLDDETIERMIRHHEFDPIIGGLFVYRTIAEPPSDASQAAA